jgi:glycosyltransferase involved in cell wall biosynthesis
VRDHQAVLVHTHDAHGHTAAVLAATFFGMDRPLVVSRRVDFPVRSGFSARHKYGHPSVKRILCVSDAIRELMAPALPDPSVLRTVRSGVDPARFAKGPDGRLRRKLDLPPNMPLVGLTAALAPHKDLHTFLATAAVLQRRGIKAHFVLMGDGPLRSQLEEASRQLGLQDMVSFTGFRADVERLLPELDVFLITSRTEGLGTSILDAFACRVPVVATRAGGIPEIVHDGHSGLLCTVGDAAALADAVAGVLADAELRQRLVEGGLQVLAQHLPRAVAEHTLQAYREVLAGEVAKHSRP